MTASAVSRGGVKFEFRPDVSTAEVAWRAASRYHEGTGPTLPAAAAALVKEVEAELLIVKAAQATVQPKTASRGGE